MAQRKPSLLSARGDSQVVARIRCVLGPPLLLTSHSGQVTATLSLRFPKLKMEVTMAPTLRTTEAFLQSSAQQRAENKTG